MYAACSSSLWWRMKPMCKIDDEEATLWRGKEAYNEVHNLILLSSSQWRMRPTPRPPSCARGQEVWHLIHRNGERRSRWCTPPFLLAMEYTVYSSSLRWRRQPTREIEDEEYNAHSITRYRMKSGLILLSSSPYLLLAMEHTLHTSSSSILRVGYILHHEDEDYTEYSIMRRRQGVHGLLLILAMEYTA